MSQKEITPEMLQHLIDRFDETLAVLDSQIKEIDDARLQLMRFSTAYGFAAAGQEKRNAKQIIAAKDATALTHIGPLDV